MIRITIRDLMENNTQLYNVIIATYYEGDYDKTNLFKGDVANIPDDLTVDITTLGLGKQINAGDIKVDGIQIVSPKSTLVVAVRMTRNAAAESTESAE